MSLSLYDLAYVLSNRGRKKKRELDRKKRVRKVTQELLFLLTSSTHFSSFTFDPLKKKTRERKKSRKKKNSFRKQEQQIGTISFY
jgi:hypothetical protein